MPSRECFEADQPRRLDIDDRLKVQRQFCVEIDPPQRVLDGAELADFDFVLPGEDHRLAAVSRLGVVERIVGALVEQFGRRAGIRRQCKSDRAADLGDDPGDGKRRVENGADFCADRKNGLGIEARIDDDPELVTTETRDELRVIGQLQEAPTGFLQHPVADPVSVEIVHRLEAVEIEHADDESVVRRSRLF